MTNAGSTDSRLTDNALHRNFMSASIKPSSKIKMPLSLSTDSELDDEYYAIGLSRADKVQTTQTTKYIDIALGSMVSEGTTNETESHQ